MIIDWQYRKHQFYLHQMLFTYKFGSICAPLEIPRTAYDARHFLLLLAAHQSLFTSHVTLFNPSTLRYRRHILDKQHLEEIPKTKNRKDWEWRPRWPSRRKCTTNHSVVRTFCCTQACGLFAAQMRQLWVLMPPFKWKCAPSLHKICHGRIASTYMRAKNINAKSNRVTTSSGSNS